MKKPVLQTIPIQQLQPGKYQPRKEFDPEALGELAQSIKSVGLLQPLVIRPIDGEKYEIIAGERRWRACQLAGLDSINCIITHFDDETAAEATAIENINRVDLNPIEEAKAYQRLIDDFGYIHDEVAAAVGKSRVKISNSLRLLKLIPSIQQLLIENKLSEGHGKALAALQSEQQLPLARKAVSRAWSVRKLEQEVKKAQLNTPANQNKTDVNIKHFEQHLSEQLGCKTQIDFDTLDGQGQLKIDFHNLDALEGIVKKIGVELV